MIQIADVVKRRMPLIFGLALALISVIAMNQHIVQKEKQIARERAEMMKDYQSPIEVIVASKDLKEGTKIDASMLAPAQIPEKFAQPYVARAPRDVVGMMTAAPIAKNEQVLLNKVRRPEEMPTGTTLSSLMSDGKRAVTIGIDAMTGVGGFVSPGDKVDILWTFKLPSGANQESQVVTLTLFQDVVILAAGGEMAGRRAEKTIDAARENTVTLALTPQDISFLLFAREQGRIQLSLRSQQETQTQVAVAPTNISTILETKLGLKAPAPPVMPKPPHQVEVFKGLKRDVVVLANEENR